MKNNRYYMEGCLDSFRLTEKCQTPTNEPCEILTGFLWRLLAPTRLQPPGVDLTAGGRLRQIECRRGTNLLRAWFHLKILSSVLLFIKSPSGDLYGIVHLYLWVRLKQSIDSKNPRGPGLRGFLFLAVPQIKEPTVLLVGSLRRLINHLHRIEYRVRNLEYYLFTVTLK